MRPRIRALIGVALAVAAGVIMSTLAITAPPARREVPLVVGASLAEARATLGASGLRVRVGRSFGRRSSSERCVVHRQRPAPYGPEPPTGTVTLDVDCRNSAT